MNERSFYKTLILLLVGQSLFAQHLIMQAEEILKSHVSENRSAGISAGYATNEQILWIGSAGLMNVESRQIVDSSTRFRSASLAKPMTAVALMQLSEQGSINLDQPVIEYLPEFPIKGGESITARHLLEHASGIGDYASTRESESKVSYKNLREAMAVFEDRDLLFTPGQEFYYSTYGYVVLGWIVEEVSGLSYETYMRKNIWNVAGMYDTGVELYDETDARHSKLYIQKNTGKSDKTKNNKIELLDKTDLSNRVPGGGLYSTVGDLLRFGQAILNNKLLSQSTLEQMWKDSGIPKQGNPYGLGWYLYGNNPKYGDVFGHSGTQAGASNQLMILPDEKIVIVVLSNTARVWEFVFNISVKLFDLAVTDSRS